jgi:hypothetical protein
MFMSLQHRVLATAGAVVLLGATLATVMGQNVAETNISVTIIGDGNIAASLSGSPDTAIAANEPTNCTAIEDLILNVRDGRGLANGWSVLMSVQPDSGISGPRTLTFWPRSITVSAGNPDLAGHSVFETVAESARFAVLWSAANHFGDGAYALGITSTSTSPCDATHGVQTLIVSTQGAAP